MRRVVTGLCVLSIVGSALTGCASEPDRASTTVGSDGFELTLGGVTASAPAGVAPPGTEVVLEKIGAPLDDDLVMAFEEIGPAVSLTLGNDMQPATPITLAVKIDDAIITDEGTRADTLLMLSESADGTRDLIETTRDGDMVTAVSDHLSSFWPVQIDLSALFQQARDFVLQALGTEYPRPDCAEREATVSSGVSYLIRPSGVIWPCISATGDTLTVDLYAATSMPYRALSSPGVVGETVASPNGEGILMALANRHVPSISGGTILGGDAPARFVFDASSPPEYFDARQDAHMLIGAVLLRLLGIVLPPLGGGTVLDKIGQLDCMSEVVEVGTSTQWDAATIAAFFQAFMACAGTVAGASYPVRLILGLVGAVPALFSGVVLGFIREVTGEAVSRLTLETVLPTWTISADGIGPVQVGSTTWQELVSRTGFRESFSGSSPQAYCVSGGWFDSATVFNGMSALADGEGPTPGAVDVVGVNVNFRTGIASQVVTRTREGIGLGSSEDAVRQAYPGATVQPDRLSVDITQYRVENGSGRAMNIAVLNGEVIDISVGAIPEVYYPEGCL